MWPFRRRTAALSDQPLAPEERDLVVVVDDRVDPRVVMYHDPAGHQAEQYRGFRTNLRAMNPGDQPRTLLFTSAHPREGKSVTVANIACALAECEALKVCLLDADLRGGTLHRLFGGLPGPGLTDVLLDGVAPRKALQSTPLKNLSLLSTGRAADNPGELFASAYLQELLAFLKRSHQYVIVDTPPALAFADAAELSKLMDGVILVVAISETTKRDAERVLTQMSAAGANVTGTFVTGAAAEDVGAPPPEVEAVEDEEAGQA
ncbi:MAG: CpsD/CapB family tyrosine-protein kinase [Planctomycetes bacterium]|nr:CpsD/CapB family tyrosine-protein kinase [Planctomycetota bacterium]